MDRIKIEGLCMDKPSKKAIEVAKKYRAAYFKAKKATTELDALRQQVINTFKANSCVGGVYHIIRNCLVPNEVALKHFGHFNKVSKVVVDIGKLGELITVLERTGKKSIARELYSHKQVHEVAVKKP